MRLTPKGRAFLGRWLRQDWMPSPRGVFLIIAFLVIGTFAAWSAGSVFLAIYAIFAGLVIGAIVMLAVFRSMLEQEALREDAADTLRMEQLKAEMHAGEER